MNPFDEMIAEETEPEHQELLVLLQQVYRKPNPITPAEQEQMIGSVRERLLHSRASATGEDFSIKSSKMTDKTSQSQPPAPTRVHQGTRLLRVMNTLAAVLVVSAIIGASLLLFTHRPHASETVPTGPAGSPATVRTEAGGLEMAMSITPGPYFLGEML